MLFQPAILALTLADLVSVLLMGGAALFAWQVVRHWDLTSGSGRQLRLERRTYLAATLVAFACLSQAVALLLFVFNADRMAELFSGAMCAVGSLNAAPGGFAALELRLLLFFLAAAWLVVNHLDNQAPDYPLIRPKYALLLLILPVALAAALVQGGYYLGLDTDVITSCCGSLFGAKGGSVQADLAAWPPAAAMAALALLVAGVVGAGLYQRVGGRGLPLVCALGVVGLPVALAAVLSFVSLYVYEHPHHHCPFCLLKAEYGYVGYGLYPPLFTAAALSLGLGLVLPLARAGSMRAVVDHAARRFVLLITLLYGWVGGLVGWIVWSSNLKLLE